jgi:hypothetical protein
MDTVAGVTETATSAVPVPLRPITVAPLVEELLLMVSWPVAAPTAVGLNCIFSTASSPGSSVVGSVGPDNVKPEPVSVVALIVTGAVPVEDKVTGCVVGVLTTTSPKATLVALMLRARIAALSCRVKFFIMLPALAVIVTAWAVATEDTVAVNWALVAFAGTVTVLGIVKVELLLARFTGSPPSGAAAVSVRVHASVPDPVMAPLLQYIALSAAVPMPVVPVPLRLITGDAVVEELLAIVSCPVVVPAAAGLNWTFKV